MQARQAGPEHREGSAALELGSSRLTLQIGNLALAKTDGVLVSTQAELINTLLTLAVDPLPDSGFTNIGGVNFNRSDNFLCGTLNNTCPEATAVGSIGDDSPPIQATNIDVTNWTYLKGKYGDTMFVWYVANINDVVNIPTTAGTGGSGLGSGGGLSHWILYNPTTTTVPDGGATLGLLGLGMLGLGMLRRRLF